MATGVTNPIRISPAITLMSAVRAVAAPTAHSFFPCLEYRAVSVMRGKLGVEKGKDIREGGRAPRLWSIDPQLQQRPLYCTHA